MNLLMSSGDRGDCDDEAQQPEKPEAGLESEPVAATDEGGHATMAASGGRGLPHRCKSSPSSCLSSEADLGLRSPTSPDTAASMVLAGCPRCLMYVMLSRMNSSVPCAITPSSSTSSMVDATWMAFKR
ncbi:hypothetical protein MUK42_15422 [Musa troglodytarum]|uniref:GIR1-like zinc ribbon domain-containing protein n=1 Tax=Musa troglodytarum TaxID=320322 RepID=A0A9E7H631_9LILI|nr:hypothetical protein MUK42_15422 [Musa troglodytarum]